jgi:signal transduction histidine kinase
VIGGAFAQRLGLAARIGLAIIAAVVAIQVLVTLVFLLNPPPFPPFYSARWLSGAVAEIVRHAKSGEAEPGGDTANVEDGQALAVRVDRSPPGLSPGKPRWPLDRVLATVRSELGDGAGAATVDAAELGPQGGPFPVVPSDAFATLPSGPLGPGEDMLAPPRFLFVVDLHDGRWLTIGPSGVAAHRRLIQSLAIIFAGTLIAAAVAVLTARSLIAPLSGLAAAAERLGRSRQMTETHQPAIREFVAIHDAFDAMQRRLKRFVDERTHMLAAISHDLRTPLARLRLQAEFVKDSDLQAGMLANVDAMRDMLTETLSFAQGEATSESPALFDLASVLISLCDEASDAGAKVEYAGRSHATASGKRTAIRRMFSNLIDNAVRYGGEARVMLSQRANDWVVTVADDGPGIPPDLFDKAFEPFQRLESSRSRETGGTGLGLSIARDVALGHGGQITLANAPAGSSGLVVTVLLPKAAA